ncbi:MAG: bifunctional serine/threonine-protein kinase/formylglycine-generating enzyme family protein [Gammaproteobacteria bacterium]
MAQRGHRNALPGGYRLFWYRIERVLGQGSFGITYLATDLNLHHPVAIKEYLPVDLAVREEDSAIYPATDDRYAMYSWGLERFLREAQALAKFKHPNIVRVHSVFEANNTAYMVMDYEEGDSLAAYLCAGRLRTESDLRELLFSLLDGLEQLHEAGFIHRDIKPANIYVRSNGTPVLLDFGSARLVVGTKTRTLTSLVTTGYAPVEQYGEGGHQGPWTDIYALGATLYTAIVGCAPVDAIQRSYARLGGKPDPLEPVARLGRERFSERFLYAIESAMRFLPEERPQSVAEWRQMFIPPEEVVDEQARESTATEPTTALSALPFGKEALAEQFQTVPLIRDPAKLGLLVALLVTVLGAAGWMYMRTQPSAGSSLLQEAVKQPEHAERPASPPAQSVQAESERGVPEQQVPGDEIRESWPVEVPSQQAQRKGQPVEDEIASLLEKAERAFSAIRLTTPVGDNAFEYYQSVLALEPEHPEAQHGLQRIVARYVELADRALKEDNFDQAEAYVGRAEGILPEEAVLTRARERLLEARRVAAAEERERLAELERQREEELQQHRAEEAKRTEAFERQHQQTEPKAGTVFRDDLPYGAKGPKMVVIPAGSFIMGSPEHEEGRKFDEGPQHRVTISKPFAIGRYEVTFDEYDHFTRETGREQPSDKGMGRGRRPVIDVYWYDAAAYAKWLAEQTGEKYRLPSEAEWEYAARAGTATRFWWDDDVGRNRANCDGCGSRWDAKATAPVGSFAPNPFGIYDTAGNVSEWTQDCYKMNYEGVPTDGSAWLPEKCVTDPELASRFLTSFQSHVVRGGSWQEPSRRVRSAARALQVSGAPKKDVGFRIARDL